MAVYLSETSQFSDKKIPVGNRGKIKILVAEQNKESRTMLRTFLEPEGYRVIEARDGEEAIRSACFELPDLILMDLNMPLLGGLEAIEQIRQNSKLSEIPILANSADGARGIELFLNINKFGKGFIEYLTKPFNCEELVGLIAKVLHHRDKLKTN